MPALSRRQSVFAPVGRRAGLIGLACLVGLTLLAQAGPAAADFGAAILTDWVRPEYPAEARKAKAEGTVVVEFVVEADGSVSRESVHESEDERFNQPALAAVRQWKFKPALEHGAPVVSALRVPVVFELAQLKQKKAPLFPPEALWPVPVKETPAAPDRSIEPDYPAELEERQLPGEVHIEFTVDAAGAVSQPRVLWATHPAFVETSLQAIARAGFAPARQGPLVKASRVQYPVLFGSMGVKPSDVLAANGLTVRSGESLVRQPQVKMLVPPVFPRERWLAGESGSCEAEFTVDAQGVPREIAILQATQPEFAAAFTAAIEAWAFKPAQNEQGPVAVRIHAVHEFAQRSDLAEFRLGRLLKPGAEGIDGPAGLERKIQPLWRGFPVYPQALLERKPSGEALIEFIIDRGGRARLPLVVSATEEAFGWAAATAVSQWVFEPPVREGQPADVRVRIPVAFKPPEK